MPEKAKKPANQKPTQDQSAQPDNVSPIEETVDPAVQSGAGSADQQPETSSQDETGDAAAATPEEQIAKLTGQIEDLTKRLLTAHAEIQNLHRRHERERAETAKYAITKFARDTVAMADNFERAIASVPDEAADENPVLKALLDGVTMTEREFLNVLERHGVKRITPEGEVFDPHFHQAMMEQDDKSVPAGTILNVHQAGYIIEDRVLRPALVIVAKGGPKLVKDPTSAPDEIVTPAKDSGDAAANPDGASKPNADDGAQNNN